MWALPALAAVAVFANTVTDQFVYDDRWAIARLVDGNEPTSKLLATRWGLSQAVNLMDLKIWGPWAPGFHLTNVALHSLASLLAASAAFALSRSRLVGLLAGVLFAVHPVHVEAIASFVNRRDILAMIFVSLALTLWVHPRRGPWHYVGALFCYTLALWAKEVAAVGLAPMLFLADLLPSKERFAPWPSRLRSALPRSTPFLIVALAIAVVMADDLGRYFSSEWILGNKEGQLTRYTDVLATSLSVIPDLFGLLFFPLDLSADYVVAPRSSFGDPAVLFGAILLALWIAATVVIASRAPLAAFAMAWIPIMYAACSNIVPVGIWFLADRYCYVPSFGVCLLIALGFERALLMARRRGQPVVGSAILGVFILLACAGAARSFVRNGDWKSEHALWSSALRSGHETWRVREFLGVLAFNEARYEEALAHYTRAVELGDRIAKLRAERASALAARCRLREAAAEWGVVANLLDRPELDPDTRIPLEVARRQLRIFTAICAQRGTDRSVPPDPPERN